MPEEDEVNLYDYIKVVSKRKWLIIIGTFACIFTAAVVTFLLPRVYETRSTLTMEGPDTPDVKIGVLNIPTGLSLDKFFNFLPGDRDLDLKVIRKLGLDKSPDELTPQALGQMITFSLAKDSRTIIIKVRYSQHCSIAYACLNCPIINIWISSLYSIKILTSSKKVQNNMNGDASSPNTWLSTTNMWIACYSSLIILHLNLLKFLRVVSKR